MSNIRKTKKCGKQAKNSLTRQTSDISNIRKTKQCCKHPKSSFSSANIRYVKHPKKKTKSAGCWKHPKRSFSRANIRYVKHPKNQKVLQTSENQLNQGKHQICQISEEPKSAANMRKPALPGQTSNMSKIRKTKKCCKHPKTILPWQTSDMSNIRKTKKCCKHPKSSFSRPNIRYVKRPKNQKVLHTWENQLNQGKHQIYRTSQKPKSAGNIRKPALPGRTSDMSNIQKIKKCCKHAKTSFTRANIRYVKHPKNQNVLQKSENQLNQGKHQECRTSEKPKSAAIIQKPACSGRTSDMSTSEKTKSATIIQKPALPWQTSECQTSEKQKGAGNFRKANFPGQTSDMSNNQKTKKCCKHAKTSFARANIRFVKHPKNQKVLQTSENQLYQGEHPICQTSEKPKSAANIRKPALPCQTSDMSNIRKTKRCWKHPKSKLSRANLRYVKHPKNKKVLQTCENQLYQGKHPICQTSEKPKSAANLRKPALPGQTSDMSSIRKTKNCCKHPKSSFSRATI